MNDNIFDMVTFDSGLSGVSDLLDVCRWQELVVFGIEQVQKLSCLCASQHSVGLIVNCVCILKHFWNKFLMTIIVRL